MRGRWIVPLVLLCGVIVQPATAQILPLGAATQQVPPGSPLPRVLPPALPPVTMPAAPAAPPGVTVPNATVRITSVAVEGVTVYPAPTFAAATQELVGPSVPLKRVEAARQAILQRYRGDGYVLSTVAASIDAAGALRFVVTEGHIASVKLSRDIGPAGVRVLAFLKRLTEQTPINEATLERYLLLAQDVPGITLHAVLQPSAEEPGALNLIAEVSRAPVSGLLTSDNYASNFTGPVESLLVVNLNSFTQLGEQTQVSLYHTWLNSQTFGQASTQVFIGDDGLTFRLYGGDGIATPTGALAAERYRGITSVFGFAFAYPLIRLRQETLNLTASLDAVDTNIITNAGVSADYLRVARIGANYVRSDLLFGDAHSAVNALTARVSQGLPTLGASANGGFNLPRPGERIDFYKFDAQASRTQVLFSPWQDATVSALGLLAGQWTPQELPPAEEFYLGGLQYDRGYYSGEVSGDKALTATAELQLETGIDLSTIGLAHVVPTQFYAFYDWGEVWQNDKQSPGIHINSVGGGVRITATSYAELDFTGLARLNRYPTGTSVSVKPLGPGAFLWRLLARF